MARTWALHRPEVILSLNQSPMYLFAVIPNMGGSVSHVQFSFIGSFGLTPTRRRACTHQPAFTVFLPVTSDLRSSPKRMQMWKRFHWALPHGAFPRLGTHHSIIPSVVKSVPRSCVATAFRVASRVLTGRERNIVARFSIYPECRAPNLSHVEHADMLIRTLQWPLPRRRQVSTGPD